MKNCKYNIFETRWGHFTIAAEDKHLITAILPLSSQKNALNQLKNLVPPSYKFEQDNSLFPDLPQAIIAYFQGQKIDFTPFQSLLPLDTYTPFKSRVLFKCITIPYSQTLTYKQLAKLAKSPSACRAVGNIMASNPFPLIIPCHRVIKSDGTTGGFSAYPDPSIKSKLLNLENQS